MNKIINKFSKIKYNLACKIHDISTEILHPFISSEVVNLKELRVVGLRRSGNHAIINWIRRQMLGEVWHLNNIPVNQNPYRFLYQHYPKQHLNRESLGNFVKKDCLIYSYEDYALEQISNSEVEKKHDLYLGKSLERYDLLIVRDPYNMLASRIKKDYMTVKTKNKTVVDLWIAYAQEYLGETNYLAHQKIVINYNNWVLDVEYRKQLAAQLKLNFTDAGFTDVKQEGGGSSFDELSFAGKANQMDVNNRWKYFADNELYRELINNQELKYYSEKIFGAIANIDLV